MPRHKPSQPHAAVTQWELHPGSRVWVYLRHSPGDKQTIDSQVTAMQQWCAENGWAIERMFIDEAMEGSNEARPQFQEMMAHSRQMPRLVDGIVIWSFSRFARSQLDSQFYKADLRKRGFVVISKIDDIPNNEIAPIIEAVVDWKNQRFLEDLSADIKRGQHWLVEQGYFPSGSVSIGYRVEKVEIGIRPNGDIRYGNKLVKDEAVAERVVLAWKMKLEQNASFIDIHNATHLYGRYKHYGIMFRNMIYAGILEFGGKRYPLDWENSGCFCEQYVTLDEFLRVQHNLDQRTIKVVSPRLLSSPYLLTGLLRCGECAARGHKSPLIGSSGRYRCIVKSEKGSVICSLPSYRAHKIDEQVITYFKQSVLTPEYLRAEFQRASFSLIESRDTLASQIEQLGGLSKEYEEQLESLITLIAKKGMSPLLEKQYDHLNGLWNNAQVQLATLRKQAALANTQATPSIDVAVTLDEMLAIIDDGLIAPRRALFARFVEAVYVYADAIHIHLKFKPDDSESHRQILLRPSKEL